jgi:phospholipid transport system transporter-binding protein
VTATVAGFELSAAQADTLRVGGALTFGTAREALAAIDQGLRQGARSQLDLSAVQLCDSAGLACVLAVLAQAGQRGQAVRVTHPPAGLLALARVCEVESLLLA